MHITLLLLLTCLFSCSLLLQYMSKFNDVKTKRGVDFAEHLVAYYQAQEEYFQDGNLVMKALKAWEERFTTQCSEVKAGFCISLVLCIYVLSSNQNAQIHKHTFSFV